MWPFTHHAKKTVLCIDMGSASVGVAAVVLAPEQKPYIAYHTRIPLVVQDRVQPDAFARTLSSYLSRAILDVSKSAPKRIKKVGGSTHFDAVFTTFSSPWFTTSIHTAYEHFEEPQEITNDLMNIVVDNALDTFQGDADDRFHSERFSSAAEVIEYERTGVLLNGYHTNNPYNKKVHDFQAELFLSAVPRSFIHHVENTIGELTHVSNTEYHTLPIIFHRVMSTLFTEFQDGLFFDVGGDRTDIAVVIDRHVRRIYSFERGTNDLVRHVAHKRNTGNETAASTLRMYMNGELNAQKVQELDTIIPDELDRWCDECREEMSAIADEKFWSRRAFVIGPHNTTKLFTARLSELLTSFATEHNVAQTSLVQFSEELLLTFTRFADSDHFDPFLALEALYAGHRSGYTSPVPSQEISQKVE